MKKEIQPLDDMLFSEIIKFYDKNYKVLFRVFLDNLVGFSPENIAYTEGECLIIDKRISIPPKLENYPFGDLRLHKKTTYLYGKATKSKN